MMSFRSAQDYTYIAQLLGRMIRTPRKDNYPKAVGLAKFAEKHWDKFGRIQLIRLKKVLKDANISID